MAQKKLLFVFNPNSGKAIIRNHLFEIVNILSRDYDVTVYPTRGALDAYEKIRLDGGRYDRIAVSGGDGTLNEAVRGVIALPENARPPIGYIPTGTTNDFAASLGIRSDLRQAAEDVLTGLEFPCDIGRFGELTFNYVAAFGAFTDVAYDTPQQYKNALGHTAYILEGIKRLSSIKPIHMRIDCGENHFEGDYIYGMVSNSTSVAGMHDRTQHSVSLCDGLFELLLVKMPSSFTEIQTALQGIAHHEFSGSMFTQQKIREVAFICDMPVKWTLDGEFGGAHEHVLLSNMPKAVRFIIRQNAQTAEDSVM